MYSFRCKCVCMCRTRRFIGLEHGCVPAQALTCLQASGASALDGGAPDPKPRRSTNYAPPTSSGAAAESASGTAADTTAAADGRRADAAGGASAGGAAASGQKPVNVHMMSFLMARMSQVLMAKTST